MHDCILQLRRAIKLRDKIAGVISELVRKAPSILATMSKQHCRMLGKLNDSFDNVECCFDIVAVFGNNVASFGNNVAEIGNNIERNFVLSTKSKQTEHVQIVSTLSKGRNFTTESVDIVCCCDQTCVNHS